MERTEQYQEALEGLPVVLLVGDLAIGQKLLQALGDASSNRALGVIKTKYYSARVQPLGWRLSRVNHGI